MESKKCFIREGLNSSNTLTRKKAGGCILRTLSEKYQIGLNLSHSVEKKQNANQSEKENENEERVNRGQRLCSDSSHLMRNSKKL